MAVSSEPRFVPGERTLVMLRHVGASIHCRSGELGKFKFVRDADPGLLLVRGASLDEFYGSGLAGERHTERVRVTAAFLDTVAKISAGEPADDEYFRDMVWRQHDCGLTATFPGTTT